MRDIRVLVHAQLTFDRRRGCTGANSLTAAAPRLGNTGCQLFEIFMFEISNATVTCTVVVRTNVRPQCVLVVASPCGGGQHDGPSVEWSGRVDSARALALRVVGMDLLLSRSEGSDGMCVDEIMYSGMSSVVSVGMHYCNARADLPLLSWTSSSHQRALSRSASPRHLRHAPPRTRHSTRYNRPSRGAQTS